MIIKKFEEIVRQYQDNIAIKSGETSLTYGQLQDFAYCIAGTIISRGSGCGDTTALLLGHGSDAVAALLAVLKAGKIYIPLDPTYPVERLVYMCRRFDIHLLLTDNPGKELANHLARQLGNINIINVHDITGDAPVDAGQPGQAPVRDSTAYILLTSGSEGKPKGVIQTCKNVVFFAEQYIRQLKITPADRVSFVSSFSHDGAVEDIYPALLSGAALCPFDIKTRGIEEMAAWLAREKITVYHSVPTVFRYLAAVLKEENRFPHLRIVCMGAEPLRDHDIYIMRTFFPSAALAHMYGQTESSVNTVGFMDTREKMETVTLGKPLPGIKLLLLNEADEEVEPLEEGEIYVASPYLSPGYWKDPKATAAVYFSDEELGRIYKTGDRGRLEPDGSIVFTGRKDHQVKIRGFRVEPGEIESHLLNHENVKQAVVVGRRTNETGNSDIFLCAYIVPRISETFNTREIKNHLSLTLPDYMVPAYFVPLAQLPLTANGKVDRKQLPAPVIETGVPYTPPRNELEQQLLDIWSKVLGTENQSIGIDSNFFELGGHSLKATLAAADIHKTFNVKIPLNIIFNAPTIRKLSRYVREAAPDQFAFIDPTEKKEYYPLTSAQKSIYIQHRKYQNGLGYNMARVFVLKGDLEKEKLEQVFRQLIQRHESFRTSFDVVGDEPVQKVHHQVTFELEYYDMKEVEVKAKVKVEGVEGTRGLAPLPIEAPTALISSFIRPFDLGQAPLIRVGLIKHPPTPTAPGGHPSQEGNPGDKHLLMMDMHHTIYDGTSVGILVGEFLALYREKTLAPLRLQYKDFACWRSSEAGQKEIHRQENHWRRTFESKVPELHLPTDFPRPQVQDFKGDTLVLELNRQETKALKTLAAHHQATLYMVLLTLFYVLLYKLTGSEDIVIGTPVAGRRHPELQQIMGMFVNTLVTRNYPGGEKTFKNFLREVKQTTLEAFENQDYPFEELVGLVPVTRDISRNPLFDVMFVLHNNEIPGANHQDLQVEPVDLKNQRSRFDLMAAAVEGEHTITITSEYSTVLFKKQTIEKIFQHYKEILKQVTDNQDIQLKDLRITHDFLSAQSPIIQEKQDQWIF